MIDNADIGSSIADLTNCNAPPVNERRDAITGPSGLANTNFVDRLCNCNAMTNSALHSGKISTILPKENIKKSTVVEEARYIIDLY